MLRNSPALHSLRSMARPTCLVSLLLLLTCSMANAQVRAPGRSLQIAFENDLIAVRGSGPPPDYDYTHGTRVALSSPGAPDWLRRLWTKKPECRRAAGNHRGCFTSALEVGQEIYTPRRDAALPIPGERPYAGWLYGSAVIHVVSPDHLRSFRLTVGVTGQPALAAQVQNALHRLLNNERQLGWAHQLAFRPGLAVAYDERLSREQSFGGSRAGRVGLNWGSTIGNVRTALHAGTEARFGLRAPLPWVPTEPEVEKPMRFYALAGVRQEVVLNDLFIESNGADRQTLVRQYAVAVGFRGHDFTVEYRHVARGREYRAQPDAHAYGALVFALHGF
jgi:lipid A 3-O-deacylase